jgi:signal transduction histidine kinase
VTIRLADNHPDGIRFTISDDGIGFDPGSEPQGTGLHNMRERVSLMGGHITVSRGQLAGTIVSGAVRDMPPVPITAHGTDGEAARC